MTGGSLSLLTKALAIHFLLIFAVSMPPVTSTNGTWVVAIDKNYPPHEFWEDDTARGFNVEIIEAVAREMGKTIEWKPLSWNDAYAALVNGTVESLCMAYDPEREPLFDFSRPILNLTLRIFVEKGIIGINQLSDLSGHTVAVEKGDIAEVILARDVPNATIVPVVSQEDAILLVSRGEVTAAFCNEQTGSYVVQKHQIPNLKKIGVPINTGPRSIAVAEGNTQLLSEINRALEKIFSSGEYDTIYEHWFGTNLLTVSPLEVQLRIIGIALFVSGGIAISLVIWNRYLRKRVQHSTRQLRLLTDIFTHDMRNIGQSILGSLQALEMNEPLSESGRDFLGIAFTSFSRAVQLLEDFNLTDSLETRKITLQKMSIVDVIESVLDLTAEKSVQIRIKLEAGHRPHTRILGHKLLPTAFLRVILYLLTMNQRDDDTIPTITIFTDETLFTVRLVYCFGDISSSTSAELFSQPCFPPHRPEIGLDLYVASVIISKCKGTLKVCRISYEDNKKSTPICVTLRKPFLR